MQIEIRQAQSGDIPWLKSQLRDFAAEYPSRYSLYGAEDVVEERLTQLVSHHICFIADHEEHGPIGFIAGVRQKHFMNPDITMLQEIFYWVAPEFRAKTSASVMLLDAFTEWGEENAHWTVFFTNTKTLMHERHFLKRGYNTIETVYLREV